MAVSKVPASDTEEKTTYENEVYDKRDLTVTIPLCKDSTAENDATEKALWQDFIETQEKVREFKKIRMERLKFRAET